ncbi:MAG: DNA-3-methyladenine glycosylase I [Ferruginibacter sp.]|nr:DNA-3-methyladenine glycosylase I [Ferruginibacter sp.]
MSYCTVIPQMEPEARKQLHQHYHDHHYGFPIHDDDELFGRLIMEINQAGLSWETILKKEAGFRNAYNHFRIAEVAAFNESDFNRLLQDGGVIRNRLKIQAAIYNAQKIMQLQNEYGSFKLWLKHHDTSDKLTWLKLFKKTFRFTGGEIVSEFLMSIGILPGAHDEDCPVFKKILKQKPAWSLRSTGK